MKTVKIAAGAAFGAVLLAGSFTSSAQAQIYPNPEGYCIGALSDPLPDTETTVIVTVTAADRAGNPLEGVTGHVEIASQPGDDARVEPGAFVTGPDGRAEVVLYTGDTPGTIVLAGPCDRTQLSLGVQVGSPPGPPATGSGPAAPSEGIPALALAGAALLLSGAGLGLARRRKDV